MVHKLPKGWLTATDSRRQAQEFGGPLYGPRSWRTTWPSSSSDHELHFCSHRPWMVFLCKLRSLLLLSCTLPLESSSKFLAKSLT
eukprot:s415_g10.t1